MSGADTASGPLPAVSPPTQTLFAFPARDVTALRHALERESGLQVQVTVTRNRVRMISVRFPSRAQAAVRLRPEFLKAPDALVSELSAYLRSRDARRWRAVAAFARAIPAVTPSAPLPPVSSQGHVWDLAALRDEVNRTFFHGRVDCRISWGRVRPQRRQPQCRGRSIRYGSWDAATRTIRIHPLLDNARVPRDFMRYLVFHEMLHVLVPVEGRQGRRIYHPAGFRALERRYPDYARMRQLSRELLRALL